MSNYIGVQCPVCNKRFEPADDIVVCPSCGAPHHRHCYAEKDKCAFADEHIGGREWRPPESEPAKPSEPADNERRPGRKKEEDEGAKSCSGCGSANPPDTIFCQVCGTRFTAGKQPDNQPENQFGGGQSAWPDVFSGFGAFNAGPADPLGGVSGEEKIAGIPVGDLMIFVGANSAYYIPRFYAAEKAGRRVSPNFAAMLFGFLYYFYRKMYHIGAILLGLFAMVLISFFLYANEVMPFLPDPADVLNGTADLSAIVSDSGILSDGLIVMYMNFTTSAWTMFVAASLGFSFFANYLYYRKAVKQVGRLFNEKRQPTATGGSFYDYHRALALSGGINRIIVFLLVATIFVVVSVASTIIVHYNAIAGGVL